jgi:hypothetical protein
LKRCERCGSDMGLPAYLRDVRVSMLCRRCGGGDGAEATIALIVSGAYDTPSVRESKRLHARLKAAREARG